METHKLRSEMQVNSMLRCSIISLCKTMVPYNAQISIQGIIGITIDNSDVLLIDVHDTIGDLGNSYVAAKPVKNSRVKSECGQNDKEGSTLLARDIKSEPTHRTEVYSDSSYQIQQQDSINLDETPEDEYQDGNDYNYDGYDDNGYINDNTHAYTEDICDDATDASTTDYQYDIEEPSDNMDHIVSQSLASGVLVQQSQYNSTQHHNNENYSNENHSVQYSNENSSAHYLNQNSTAQYSNSKHHRTSSKSSKRVRPYTKNRAFSSPASSSQSDQRKMKGGKTALLPDEVGTMYTCSICGQIIKHLGSFMRHKQKHEGVMYRCEDCGKCYSRKDNFNVHRRKCLMFMSMGGDQGDMM